MESLMLIRKMNFTVKLATFGLFVQFVSLSSQAQEIPLSAKEKVGNIFLKKKIYHKKKKISGGKRQRLMTRVI